MKNIISGLLVALILSATISSCRKTDDTPEELKKGAFKIEFNHVFGPNELPFELNKEYVHGKTGDALTFTTFKYYVSNIKLVKNDGTIWKENESYHIVKTSDPASMILSLKDVPAGTYKELQYTMGVDSIRNESGAQDGALAPSNGMFWSWNTGYIFLKAEGNSPQAMNATNFFMFHLGGFKAPNNIIMNKTTDFGNSSLVIAEGETPVVNLTANAARLWHSASSVGVLDKIHMPSATATQMASDFYSNIYFNKID